MGGSVPGGWARRAGMVALCVGLLGACSDTPGDAPPAQAGDEEVAGGFAAALDRVTTEHADRAAELQAELATIDPTDEARLLAVVDAMRGTATDARAAFGGLAIPAPVSTEMTVVLQLLDDQARALDDLVGAVRDRDTDAFRDATEQLIAIAQLSHQARQRLDVALASCGAPCGP